VKRNQPALFIVGALLLLIGIVRVESINARLLAVEKQSLTAPEASTDELELLTPGQIKYVSRQLGEAHVAVASTEDGKRRQAATYRSARFRNKSTAEAIDLASKVK
jgi:hypothetical protein